MIQLNLLPDVKIAFIKARAQKHLVILSSIVIGGMALGIFVLLFLYVNVVQAGYLKDLTSDIKTVSTELTGTKVGDNDLNDILTIQKQLTSIDALHAKKPATDRLTGYIALTTPDTVNLTQYEVDFSTNSMVISGKSATFDKIEAYVKTLKSVQFVTKDDKTPKNAYSEVTVTNFSPSSTETTFTLGLKYDPIIFNSLKEVTLSLPGQELKTNENALGGEQ
ncbi:MAG: hypothetical protein WBP26_04705 [Candidatus Saccharimonadales bacterium]